MTDPTPRGGRRDPSRDERLEILRLLEGGTITAEEAAQLLDALERADRAWAADSPTTPIGGRAKQVRIRMTDTDTGEASLDLVFPLGFIETGLGIARRYAPDRVPDAQTIQESITTGFRGPLLDLNDGGERIEIIVE
jgi:hypothetical protein